MNDWKKTVILPSASLREAIANIDASKSQIALVLDTDGHLAGIVVDGDVRRALLAGIDLSAPIVDVMNSRPTSAAASTPRWRLLNRMRDDKLHHLPLLDERGRVVDLVTLDDLAGSVRRPNPVVLMAGGLGTRLQSLTQHTPKPMLMVGRKPILESILESLIDQGFTRFFFAVHYQADVISRHFGDGSQWGVRLEYLREKQQLGTAGALSLLPYLPDTPLVVMNGDILTRVDVNEVLNFHLQENAMATMAVREYELQIPYGVVNVHGGRVAQIVEKPVHQYLVNAGIYIVAPEALTYIPAEEYFDMPMLFERLITAKAITSAYPIRDYWVDVGRIEELEKARREWPTE